MSAHDHVCKSDTGHDAQRSATPNAGSVGCRFNIQVLGCCGARRHKHEGPPGGRRLDMVVPQLCHGQNSLRNT